MIDAVIVIVCMAAMVFMTIIAVVQYGVIRQLSKRLKEPRSVEFGMLNMKMNAVEWQSAIDHGAFALCISDVDSGAVLGNILVERENQ